MRIPIGQTIAIGRPFIDLTQEITAAILCTIIQGWEFAKQRSEVHVGAMEVPMTECLRDGMRTALKTLAWRKTLVILDGTESRSDNRILIPDGRTDIPILVWLIFSQTEEHTPHAIIECKRIAESDSYLTREYVTEGVNRFQDGKYGGNHGKGFMVGYVLSGTLTGIVTGINHYLGKHTRHAEQLKPSPFPSCDPTWTSQHPRTGGMKTIDLYHVMLNIEH